MTRQGIRQARLVAAGLCAQCSSKRDGKSRRYCNVCAEAHRESVRRRKKQTPLTLQGHTYGTAEYRLAERIVAHSYALGSSLETCAAAFKCSPNRVREILKRTGTRIRSQGGKTRY